MIKQTIKKILHYFSYGIHKIKFYLRKRVQTRTPLPIDPIWPLPRQSDGLSSEEIRQAFKKYDLWHYAYELMEDSHF